MLPQLLNPVDEAEAEQLLADPRWWAQPKFDGRRLLIRKSGSEVVGINRTGLLVGGLPELLVAAVRAVVAGSCLLDGEAVGDVYHCFDLLERDGADLRDRPYTVRFAGAADLVDPTAAADALRRAETATTAAAKRAMLDRLRATGRRGSYSSCARPRTPPAGRPAAARSAS